MQNDELEKQLTKKFAARDKKHHPTMKVSGKSVFKLAEIIKNRPIKNRSKKTP